MILSHEKSSCPRDGTNIVLCFKTGISDKRSSHDNKAPADRFTFWRFSYLPLVTATVEFLGHPRNRTSKYPSRAGILLIPAFA